MNSYVFDHKLFETSPALAALKTVADPKPEHVRACLVEMMRILVQKEDGKDFLFNELRRNNEDANKSHIKGWEQYNERLKMQEDKSQYIGEQK